MFDGPTLHPVDLVALTSIEAEAALLGALIAKPSLLEHLPRSFAPEHYGCNNNEDIHRLLVEVSTPGVPAGILISQMMAPTDPSIREYVPKLITSAVSFLPAAVAQYAEMVTELYRRRRLLLLSATLREQVIKAEPSAAGAADALIATSMTELDTLFNGSSTARPAVSFNQALDAALAKTDEATRRDGPAGLSTGFRTLDDALGGLENGTLNILAGRPGMGKSALGHAIAVNAARSGVGVLEISLEMSATALAARALSSASGVPLYALKRGVSQEQMDRLVAARREMNNLPLTIEDGGGLTASMIALRARAAKRKHKLGLIMIDHLHIVATDAADAKNGATWATGKVSGACKRLAKEFDCPVLLLAQLNRGVENREDKRPGLPDLRQSGDIEQDADAVMFVYRAEYYLQREPTQKPTDTAENFAAIMARWTAMRDEAAGRAELILAKVRDGEPQTIPLLFDGATTSFSEEYQ